MDNQPLNFKEKQIYIDNLFCTHAKNTSQTWEGCFFPSNDVYSNVIWCWKKFCRTLWQFSSEVLFFFCTSFFCHHSEDCLNWAREIKRKQQILLEKRKFFLHLFFKMNSSHSKRSNESFYVRYTLYISDIESLRLPVHKGSTIQGPMALSLEASIQLDGPLKYPAETSLHTGFTLPLEHDTELKHHWVTKNIGGKKSNTKMQILFTHFPRESQTDVSDAIEPVLFSFGKTCFLHHF